MRWIWIALVIGSSAVACTPVDPETGVGAVPPPGRHPRALPPPRPAAVPDPSDPECTEDADCLLLPWVTCCGECPAAPPFDVGPIESLDAILIESEERCALDRRPCEEAPVCEPVPASCTARAACAAGACVVIEDGCGDALI